jgi:hypothetical protein
VSSAPLSRPGAKLTLVLAIFMTLIGFLGVGGSISLLTAQTEGAVAPQGEMSRETQERAEELNRSLFRSPLRKGTAVANLLASALLIIGSFLLTARVRSALWWSTQALIANAIYSVASAVCDVYLVRAHDRELRAVFDSFIADAAQRGEEVPADAAGSLPVIIIAGVIGFGVLQCVLYLGFLRLLKREDVQRFVRRES